MLVRESCIVVPNSHRRPMPGRHCLTRQFTAFLRRQLRNSCVFLPDQNRQTLRAPYSIGWSSLEVHDGQHTYHIRLTNCVNDSVRKTSSKPTPN